MRLLFLAASVLIGVAIAGVGSARADSYPICSREGVGIGQDCSFETIAQCEAAVKGMGTDCFKNPRYKPPAVVAPAPQPDPLAPRQKRRTTSPPGTKS